MWRGVYRKLIPLGLRHRVRARLEALLARMVIFCIKPVLHNNRIYFDLWEKHGFHITPVHFYSPIPNTRELPDSLWKTESDLPGINMNEAGQLHLLRDIFPQYHDEYRTFAHQKTEIPYEYYFENGSFIASDPLVLYCMVRHFKPKRVLEIGGGFSTLVTARAAQLNENTEVTCIEPYPNETLRAGFPGLTRLIEQKVQGVDPALFTQLEAGDILFVDTSHVVKCGSEVNTLFLEIFPRLNNGVIVHIHDIFFPLDYPRSWLHEHRIFWNEQYLLQAFLIHNAAFEVLFCNSFMALKYFHDLKTAFPEAPAWGGGSFWMRKRGEDNYAENRND